jgi:hypothetical protein
MPSSLNSGVQAKEIGYGVVQCLRKRITYLNAATAITVGKLPPGSVVVGGGVQIITTFNDSGTDTIDVGTSADADAFGTLLTVSATAPAYVAFDELATTNDYSDTAEVTVTATYNSQNSDATAGVADVVVMYVTAYPTA